MKKSSILIFILVLIMFNNIFAQNKYQNKISVGVRIKQNKPSVYIVPESDLKLNKLAEVGERILLRLHNNSRWGILLEASGGYAEYEDGSIYYKVFEKDVLQHNQFCHVCSVIPLSSGKSFLFSVPKEYLAKDFSLRIQFDYEWEKNHYFESDEVIHYVQFFSRDLPTKNSLK